MKMTQTPILWVIDSEVDGLRGVWSTSDSFLTEDKGDICRL